MKNYSLNSFLQKERSTMSSNSQTSTQLRNSLKPSKERAFLDQNSQKSTSSTPTLKTPLKTLQEPKPFTTVKPIFKDKSELKDNEKDLKDFSQEQRRKNELIKTSEKKLKLCIDFSLTCPNEKSFSLPKNPPVSTTSSSSICPKTPAIQACKKSFENEILKQETVNLKRKFALLDSPPLYKSNKRVKCSHKFYSGQIKLYNKLKKQHLKFRVFKDSDLGYNKQIQSSIQECRIDDDCPTDSEQIELAITHAKRELHDAIDLQTLENNLKNKTPSNPFSSYTHSEDDDFTDSKSFVSDDVSDYTMPSQRSSFFNDGSLVVKKLSFS